VACLSSCAAAVRMLHATHRWRRISLHARWCCGGWCFSLITSMLAWHRVQCVWLCMFCDHLLQPLVRCSVPVSQDTASVAC
jgi:hypothetical protein